MKYEKKLVLFSLFAMNLVDNPAPEVTIEQGILSGKLSKDGTFFEYTGIPYASTNASTRFQAPGPPPSWTGVYKAVDDYYMCPQAFNLGSEDCLKINIFVPSSPHVNKPLPVMVYIHGGAFLVGSGGKLLYGPGFIVKKDVIMVSFNYRLGLLGFLCLRIKEAPGNAGLKDQIAALRWVKKNIAAFGGDPDNITLFGLSAGATSASLLLASEAANGLFNRVIIQSGTSTANWSINRNPVWAASLLAKAAGYNTEDPKELYQIFSKMNFKEILSLKATKPLDLFYDTQLLNLPCVENIIPGIEPVITDLPYNVLAKNAKNVDVIFGTTSREGIFLVGEETEETLCVRNGRYLFASDLEFTSTHEAQSVADIVQKFYFSDDKISIDKASNVTDLYTHLYFEIPTILETELLVNRSNSKTYNYIFDYNGGRNYIKMRSGLGNERGSSHGDDIFYLFKGDMTPMVIREDDKRIIEYMTTLWTNFAKYGNPTPESSDLPIKWIPSTKGNLQFLYIDRELKMGPMPNPEAYRMWKDIYVKYRKTYAE